jgi:glycolate oxidase iron-sulfur subunit
MKTLPLAKPKLDEELLLDCVHCGLCTASCPTYAETGHEADSPRGRIYLMRSVIEGSLELDETVKGHLDLCLNCRACETACPSGVQYGKLIEPFRLHMDEIQPGRSLQNLSWWQRPLVMKIFPSRTKTKLALLPAKLAQRSGLDGLLDRTGLTKLLPKSLGRMRDMLPALKPHYGTLPEIMPAEGKRRAKVGLFLGCVADALYPDTQLNTARVLQKNGVEVWIPRAQGCCGALHYHAADERTAAKLVRHNVEVFAEASDLDAIVTNAAGCGAMLKDAAHLLPEAAAFQAKVRDISEFLDDLGLIPPPHPLKLKATYHDACHLRHAQGIHAQPRSLLHSIKELELIPLPESDLCCGAAGSYNLTQPEMAARLGDRKAANILATGAQACFIGNVGCLMQIAKHLKAQRPDIWCAHPVDALWAAYSGSSH